MAFARSGGGFASEIVLPAGIVTPIPKAMDWVSAAAFPVAYGTAHFALDYRGNLKKGETLLVLGAAGGVGLAAIEIGKFMGARVIAAAGGPEKLAICREHGADDVIDYTTENLRDRVLALDRRQGRGCRLRSGRRSVVRAKRALHRLGGPHPHHRLCLRRHPESRDQHDPGEKLLGRRRRVRRAFV